MALVGWERLYARSPLNCVSTIILRLLFSLSINRTDLRKTSKRVSLSVKHSYYVYCMWSLCMCSISHTWERKDPTLGYSKTLVMCRCASRYLCIGLANCVSCRSCYGWAIERVCVCVWNSVCVCIMLAACGSMCGCACVHVCVNWVTPTST